MAEAGMQLGPYSMGIGDRFGLEGVAQLRALQAAAEMGVTVTPVWNKSNREHAIIGTSPEETRRAADEAVRSCGWAGPYHVDADHIGMANVEQYLLSSTFFTIDVADFIGEEAGNNEIESYVEAMAHLKGSLRIPGMAGEIDVTEDLLRGVAGRYLSAIREAGRVYRHIEGCKGKGNFVTEISVDEAELPQTPEELLFLLGAIAQEGVPIQTIAPKFTGSFLKGIDYVGDREVFAREFRDDLAVLAYARQRFGLPADLRLSIHSGSDKFSLYPIMHSVARDFSTGFHLKTAGTTWLEEVAGLAASGGEGLVVAREIYAEAYGRYDEMTGPYRTVVAIDRAKLPDPHEVASWSAEEYVTALRHDQSSDRFNPHMRQLVHVGFKVAAEMGDRFRSLLRERRDVIESYVTENILHKHVEPLFLGRTPGGGPRPRGKPVKKSAPKAAR